MAEDDFPIDDVLASIADEALQDEHRVDRQDPETRLTLDELRNVLIADGAAPDSARWIYFRSPDWTWRALCGSEGWLLFDAERKTQHGFYMVVMN